MPTGYTHDIKDGIDFNTFALNCARAFGACIELRDEDGGGDKIPEEFKPSTYNLERLAEYEDKLTKLNLIHPDVAERRADESFIKECRYRAKSIRDNEELAEQYNNMLNEVVDWEPPTEDHVGLKEFMIEQIESSIKFDCGTSYYDSMPPLLTGEEWLASQIESVTDSIEYHTKENDKEIERVNDRNGWVSDLRDSLLDKSVVDDPPDFEEIEFTFSASSIADWGPIL